jgi:hypothetical protein
MDDELRALKREAERFDFVVVDAKRYFRQWDMCDPVVWAILRVVQAQNDFAYAMEQVACYGVNGDVVEAAIKERREAIAALQGGTRTRAARVPMNHRSRQPHIAEKLSSGRGAGDSKQLDAARTDRSARTD